GGLIGYCSSASDTILDCYSTGKVAVGCPGAGGLVGNHSGGAILDCYSVSKVSATNTFGGLIGGDFGGSVGNSFYDTDSTSSSANGTAESSSALKTLSTFTGAGWDFTNTWSLGGSINDGYPYLQAVTPLPVELASFSAKSAGLGVSLKWTTATEVNTNGFEVERTTISSQQSAVGKQESAIGNLQWTPVAFIKGHGTSSAPLTYSYVDRSLNAGTYSYRLNQIDNNGLSKYSTTVTVEVGNAPRVFTLSQNYPNPFNPTTTIEFTLEKDGRVSLKVYDILGREVTTLLDENRSAGEYQRVVFDGSRFASGLYFAVLEAGGKSLLKKMLMLK
ncbi:MAG TPA: T9SS type A sorting domain-containing protein, partial [Bacteroidota bacterium]